ncbi:MAG: LysM peptidoglycan-binding domain-containing protein, partial [Bdellovibrionota bacterium]|nr:LysM peptidoglycan-binding domain-containing protein [Bdellovibrionota bacterium]
FKRVPRKDLVRRKRILVKVVYEKYKVKSGDNLLKIAKKYRVRLSNLKSWNRLKRSRIFKGQVLKVKKLKQYTVREGDNLTIIAKKLKTSVRKIVRYNSLKTKKIFPRQKIHIPI